MDTHERLRLRLLALARRLRRGDAKLHGRRMAQMYARLVTDTALRVYQDGDLMTHRFIGNAPRAPVGPFVIRIYRVGAPVLEVHEHPADLAAARTLVQNRADVVTAAITATDSTGLVFEAVAQQRGMNSSARRGPLPGLIWRFIREETA